MPLAGRSGWFCRLPTACILERVPVQLSTLYQHRPVPAWIALGYVTAPIVTTYRIAHIPAVIASCILRMLIVADEVVVVDLIFRGIHDLHAQGVVGDVILIDLVVVGEVEPDSCLVVMICDIVAKGVLMAI